MKKLDLRLFGQPLSLSGGIGFAIILVSAVIVVAAPYLAPFGETAIVGDVWTGPDNTHWLGLDNLGRDMLSRILYGGRTSIIIAILITTVSFSIGISLGFIAAIAKGWTDSILSWIVDVLMSIPNLIFVLVILSIAGTSIPVLVCTIAA
jgi:peptide/nickel transport system permease protein